MKYKKIILAGGNGYLGSVLAAYYSTRAEEVIILSRRPKVSDGNTQTVVWDGETIGAWSDTLKGADMLINLCGKNVNCRYTEKNREEILRSRVVPTQLLGEAIAKCSEPPKMWINVTSATIYRHAEDRPQDEETGEIGYGFSIDICNSWEAAFFGCDTPGTRKVALRMGIVMGRHDGVFPRLLNLVKCGMGGKQGDGEQYMSWVHEQDVAACTEWLLQHEDMQGIYNCTAPNAIKNSDFMQTLRKAYGIPFGLPAPEWLLEIGAVIIGTETELILKSRWVVPAKLEQSGFRFQYAEAGHAIHDILSIRI